MRAWLKRLWCALTGHRRPWAAVYVNSLDTGVPLRWVRYECRCGGTITDRY